jgi:hypothetical protein
MTTFPGSPRLIKGAIVATDPTNPQANVIAFQYNPDTMTRKLDARTPQGSEGADKSEALRFLGPPKETFTLSIELDATDGLEQSNPLATTLGVYPALSALELLLYPKSSLMIKNANDALIGIMEVAPPAAPLTLFVCT